MDLGGVQLKKHITERQKELDTFSKKAEQREKDKIGRIPVRETMQLPVQLKAQKLNLKPATRHKTDWKFKSLEEMFSPKEVDSNPDARRFRDLVRAGWRLADEFERRKAEDTPGKEHSAKFLGFKFAVGIVIVIQFCNLLQGHQARRL